MISSIPIIDLRPHSDYQQGHLPGAVHIPFEQLPDLWHELPPKGSELQVCVLGSDKDQALELFQQRQFVINKLYLPQDLTQLELNSGDNNNRLWSGNPLVEQHSSLFKIDDESPVAIDIGCGSGRDSILLGQLGYQVIAVDVFDDALSRVQHSAKRWQLDIHTVNMDCRKHPEQLVALFEQQQPMLIMQSRFLHRPLFELYDQYAPQGCKLAVHTFLEGAEKFGSPKKADFLLKNKELAERFNHWSVLFDQVHTLEDGRPLSLFVAEKHFCGKKPDNSKT